MFMRHSIKIQIEHTQNNCITRQGKKNIREKKSKKKKNAERQHLVANVKLDQMDRST